MYIFDREDELVRKFSSCGKGLGRPSEKFPYPHGLAFDAKNHLYRKQGKFCWAKLLWYLHYMDFCSYTFAVQGQGT